MSEDAGPSLEQAFEAADGRAPAPPGPPAPSPPGRFDLWEFVRRPTGAGELASYADHPLNPEPGAPWGQRIARGLDGVTGGARWWSLDVLIGVWDLVRRRARAPGAPLAGPPPPPGPHTGGAP